MDAQQLTFADDTFDVVVAMYVASVVPDPARMVAEMKRVCKPNGQIFIVNHFNHPNRFIHLLKNAVEVDAVFRVYF